MKQYKFIIFFIAIFFLTGCNQTNQTTLETTSIEYEYVTFIGESLEYKIGDEIPNWESLFVVSDEVISHTIITDYSFDKTFFDNGEYSLTFELTLEDDFVVYETFNITVINNFTHEEIINSVGNILTRYSDSDYFSYDGESILSLERSNSTIDLYFYSRFERYSNETTMDNMYHYSMNATAKQNGNQTKLIEEFYYYYEDDVINMMSKQPNSTYWQFTQIAPTELNDYVNQSQTKDISNLLDGVEQVEYRMTQAEYVFEIPLTTVNFSNNMFIELDPIFQAVGLNDFINFENVKTTLETNYDLIKLTIYTNHEMTIIHTIDINLDDFLETSMSELNIGYTDNSLNEANIIISNFAQEEIEFNVPTTSLNYNDSGYKNYQFDGTVNDAYIDTVNNLVIYSLEDDHFIYIFNYETLELKQLYFEIMPDKITGDSKNLYITLSDGHSYYTDSLEYGGLAVVNLENLSISNIFHLDFDPYDIVVDQDGYAYITNGSNQFGELRSVNTINGQVVSEMGEIFNLSQIIYSQYTNRVYYVENESSFNGLDIFDIYFGQLLDYRRVNALFEKGNLTLSPDGQYLYTLDGTIFKLDSTFEQDATIYSSLRFHFQSVAFDPENELRFFAKDDGIYAMNTEKEFSAVYEYENNSFRMAYDDGSLINIAENIIEVIDLNDDISTYEPSIIVTIDYEDDFDINEILLNNGYGNYTSTQMSGSVDTSVLGLYEIKYNLLLNEKSFPLTVYVHVKDLTPPEITLADDTSFLIGIDESFTPPTCIVTDNYDVSPSCSVYSNNVNTSVLGSYSVTYKAIDSAGIVSYKTYTFEVALD